MTDSGRIAAGYGWSIAAMLVAMAGAFIPGYLDTHVTPLNDYLSIEAMAAICLLSSLAGALCPRLAWVAVLMIGLGLPVFHLLVAWLAIAVPRPVAPGAGDLFALLLAAVPAAAGAFWRLFLSSPITRRP